MNSVTQNDTLSKRTMTIHKPKPHVTVVQRPCGTWHWQLRDQLYQGSRLTSTQHFLSMADAESAAQAMAAGCSVVYRAPGQPEPVVDPLAEMVAAAQQRLGCNGRAEKAAQLVKAGHVTRLGEDRWVVDSQSHVGGRYFVSIRGGCQCYDARHNAPDGWCKHKLACCYAYKLGAPVLSEEALMDRDLADLRSGRTERLVQWTDADLEAMDDEPVGQ